MLIIFFIIYTTNFILFIIINIILIDQFSIIFVYL